MRIITGDECGLLKEIIPEHTRKPDEGKASGIRRISRKEDKQTRANGLASLAFLRSNNNGEVMFGALRLDGSLELWASHKPSNVVEDMPSAQSLKSTGYHVDTMNYERSTVIESIFNAKANRYNLSQPIAVRSLTDDNKLVSCDSNGLVSITTSCNEPVVKVDKCYDFFSKLTPKNRTGTEGTRSAASISSFALGQSGRAVIGGRGRETTIFDIETGERIWKAKNLKPDRQTLLQELIWSTAIEFLNSNSIPYLKGEAQTNPQTSAASDNLLAVGTGYKQVKIYDVRAQRRPILMANSDNNIILTHPVTALCQVDEHRIVVGNTAGNMHAMDLRKMKEQVGRFVGPGGSIKQIVRHACDNVPVIACVGLDRMLRTYDLRTCKLIDKIYLKQRLNCVLFCPDTMTSSSEKDRVKNNGDTGLSHDECKSGEMYEGSNIDEEDNVQDYVDSDEESEKEDAVYDGSVESKDENDSSSDEDEEKDNEMSARSKRLRTG